MNNERGFTLVEIMVAMVLITVGLLALLSTTAMTTRMISRGQRSSVAASFATQRMERLRADGCTARTNGTEQLLRGATVIARNDWRYIGIGDSTHRVFLAVTYMTRQGKWRTDSLQSAVSCQL